MAFVLSMALVGWHASPAQAVSLNELFAGQEHFRYDGVNTNGVGGYIYATAIANMNSTSDHIDEFVRLSCNCSDPGYDFDTVWVQAGRVQGALDATHNYPHSTPMYYEYNWCQDGTIGSGYGIVPIGNPGTADYPEWIYYYPATVQKTCNNTVITVQKFAIATGTMSNIVGYGLYHYFGGSQTSGSPEAYQEIAYCSTCQAERIGTNRWGLDPSGNTGTAYRLVLDGNGSWAAWNNSSSPGTDYLNNPTLVYCNSAGAWQWYAFRVTENSC